MCNLYSIGNQPLAGFILIVTFLPSTLKIDLKLMHRYEAFFQFAQTRLNFSQTKLC